MPDWKKLIAGKIAIAKKGNIAGKLGDNIRVPAGQKQVSNFPVLDMGIKPWIGTSEWRLRVFGLVENELDLDWVAYKALPCDTGLGAGVPAPPCPPRRRARRAARSAEC